MTPQPDTDMTRMAALEQAIADSLGEAVGILLLHPAWAPTLDPVINKLTSAKAILHDFNYG